MEFKRTPRQNRPRSVQGVASPSRPQPAPRPVEQPVAVDSPEVMPKPSKSFASRARHLRPTKKVTVIGGAVIAGCLVAGVILYNLTGPNAGAKTPTYLTILPAGKSIKSLGGWKRVSPPGKDPVFAYADAIDGTAISVSQQPLPQSFKDNADSQVAELAKKFNATNKVEASETTVYVGTSAKGPQSAIFVKGSTLVLIKSQKKISDASWANYAASLTSSKK